MAHEHETRPNGDHAACELVAHFPTEGRARRAEHQVSSQAASARVEAVTETQIHQERDAASEGVSTVELGVPAWVGLALGMLVGAGLGALVYASRITIAGLAPALSAGPVAVVFLGAGVLGAAGWLVGAVIHVFRSPRDAPTYEVRAVVPEDARPGVQQQLIEAGAVDVLLMEDGGNGRSSSAHARSHAGHSE